MSAPIEVSRAYASKIVLEYTQKRTRDREVATKWLTAKIADLHSRMITAEDALDAIHFKGGESQ